jgi:hypothetical protein
MLTCWPPPRLTKPIREPGFPPDDAKEAVKILTMLKDLYEANVIVGSELADDALDDAAHALWKCGLLDDLITRASRLYGPPTHIK